MDWDAEGLLEGLEDESARAARIELLDELHVDGCSLKELSEAVAEDRLVLLPVERLLSGAPRYSARDIAERAGLELEHLIETRQALGLPVTDPDARVFGEEELEFAANSRRFLEAGFPFDDTLEVQRVLGRGMASYAEALRALFAQTFLKPGDSEVEVARRFATVAEGLLPQAGPWLGHVFALHLLQLIRNDIIGLEERRSGKVSDTFETAVVFADLVGFTELGEKVPVAELGGLAGRLARLTDNAVEPPVRLVKQIGDAVMLVSPDARTAVATAIELVEVAEREDDFPQLRAGVAFGPAVNRWSDWFGGTVNLANRLTERARPGSVLVTEPAHDAAGEDAFDWSAAGEKRLKGLTAPVRAYRARRLGQDEGAR
ncbi:MAG: adenylate cyclase regulatory domain-containing protein [Solirubrobacteraceae bacterium]